MVAGTGRRLTTSQGDRQLTIAFTAIMFALSLGLALAFGLGGRDVAARLLEDAHRQGREAKEQAKSDAQTGRARGGQQVDSHTGGTSTGGSGYTATPPTTPTTTTDPYTT